MVRIAALPLPLSQAKPQVAPKVPKKIKRKKITTPKTKKPVKTPPKKIAPQKQALPQPKSVTPKPQPKPELPAKPVDTLLSKAESPPVPEPIVESTSKENSKKGKKTVKIKKEKIREDKPAPEPEIDNTKKVKAYKHLMTTLVEKHKYYPLMAKRFNREGSVRVRVEINRDGKTRNIRIIDGSGFKILDNAAKKSIKKVNIFPPPPLLPGELIFECDMTLIFKLN